MTSTRMISTSGRLGVMAVAGAVFAGACTGSDASPATPTEVSVTTVETPVDPPAPTTEPDAAVTATSTTTPTTTPIAPPTSAEPPVDSPIEETAFWRAQTMLVDEGSSDIDRALTEFALHFGPVPGSPDLQPDGSEPGTATGALEAIDIVFDDLAEEQQVAVLDRLRPIFDDAFTTVLGFASAELTPLQTEFLDLANQMADRVSSELGGTALDFEVLFMDVDPAAGDMVTNFGLGTMRRQTVIDWLERLVGTYAVPTRDCAVVIGPRGLAQSGNERKSAVAHEMFHCWSIMNSSDTAGHERTPSWYQEGVASWVGEEIAGGSSYSTNWWTYYIDSRQFALVPGLKYPAIGFWSWVDSHGSDLWSIIPALQAAAVTGDPLSVFNIATASMDAEAASTWASARVRASDWGDAWDMAGPGIGSRAHRTPPMLVPVGSVLVFDTSALGIHNVFIDPLEDIDVGADHLVGVSFQASGTWRASWASGDELSSATDSGTLAWCSASPCVCPDGSSPGGFPDPAPGAGELAVGLSGNGSSTGSLRLEVTELCDTEERPADPGDESPVGLAGTWNATRDALNRFAEVIYADLEGAEVLGTNGGATLTFDGEGAGTLRYDDLRLVVDVGGVTVDVGVTGGGSFSYVLEGTTMIVVGNDMALTFDVLGQPLELTGDDVPLGGESRYTWLLDGDLLVLQQQSLNAPLPNEWRRAG